MNKPMNTPNTPTAAQIQAAHEDVDAHVPTAGVVVELDGQQFTVAPMRFKQFMPFLKLARPIFAALVKVSSSPQQGLPPAVQGTDQGGDPVRPKAPEIDVQAALGSADWILDALEESGPQIVQALAVGIDGTGRNADAIAEQIGELTVVNVVVLAKHFIQVNASFFAEQAQRLRLNVPSILQNAAANAARAPATASRKKR